MVNTDFQVRNGLVVNSSLIVANSQTNTVSFVSNTVQVNSSGISVGGATLNSTAFSGTANTATTANNANNLGGVAANGYQTISGLSSNVAKLTANNANNLGGVAANSYISTSNTNNINVGYTITSFNIGNNTTSTITPNAQNGNYQFMISNGAFVLNAQQSFDCAIDLMIINGANAGTLTPNGFATQAFVGTIYANTYAATASVTCNAAANPFVVNWPSHNLVNNNPVFFTTTATIPTGMTANTIYYAVPINSNSFNLSVSPGSALITNTTFTSNGTTVIGYECGVYIYSMRRINGLSTYSVYEI